MIWTLVLLASSTITVPSVVVSGFANKAACVAAGNTINDQSVNKYQVICIKVK
jgi:hypothetical protein